MTATVPFRCALWYMDKIHKGGFYHDGRFATRSDVVNHYDGHFHLDLSDQEKRNLIEYLKIALTAGHPAALPTRAHSVPSGVA